MMLISNSQNNILAINFISLVILVFVFSFSYFPISRVQTLNIHIESIIQQQKRLHMYLTFTTFALVV